jgi:hypothetical protein
MPRTRDFVLFLLIVVFLVIAITGTLFGKNNRIFHESDVLKFIDQSENEHSAEVYKTEELSREDRLADMRRKISEGEDLNLSSLESMEEEILEETETDEEGDLAEAEIDSEIKCQNYAKYTGAWNPEGVLFKTVEGTRVVYKETILESTMTATSGMKLPPVTKEDILLELPIYPASGSVPNCLNTDVIGIAKGGSLIRNSEVGLYRIFGSETVIGYALDGYPIFGLSKLETDSCGGAFSAGQYGYYLADDRDVILNCFQAKQSMI